MDTNSPSELSLDLDALAPSAAQVQLKGKTMTVQPLDLPDYTQLMDINNMLASLQGTDDATDPEKVLPVYEKFKEFAVRVLPELRDEKLSIIQLMSLFGFLMKVTQPTDKAMAELTKRGIEFKTGGTDSDPKVPEDNSTSSEPSPNSSEATPDIEPMTLSADA